MTTTTKPKRSRKSAHELKRQCKEDGCHINTANASGYCSGCVARREAKDTNTQEGK